MVAFATFALAAQLRAQELKPIRIVELPAQASTERGSSYLFFSEVNNSLIALHPERAISVINPTTGKLIYHVQLKRKHPERIVLQDNKLFLFDEWFSEGEQNTGPFSLGLEERNYFIRTLDLNNFAESEVIWTTEEPFPRSLPAWISQNDILEPERHLPKGIPRGNNLLDRRNQLLVTVASKSRFTEPHRIELRHIPSLELLKSVETPWKYLIGTYLTPDGKTLILQDGNRQACIVYSLPSIHKIGVIEEPVAHLSFDPDSKWAVTHEHQFDSTYIDVKSPKLIDLNTFKYQLLDNNNQSANSAAVSSKLGFAAVLHGNKIRLFRLPK